MMNKTKIALLKTSNHQNIKTRKQKIDRVRAAAPKAAGRANQAACVRSLLAARQT
jgi:hypothetical protein